MKSRFPRWPLAMLAALTLNGCASVPVAHPDDPWEGFNRGVHAFNDQLDGWVLKPVANAYDVAAPTPVRHGVANFFGNLGDVWVGVNNLLQGKAVDAASDLGRVLLNSSVGVAGLIDVASLMGLEKHDEDFGQTLGVWGVGSGPYLVLPLYGPRTLRDGGGLLLDFVVDPVVYAQPERAAWGLAGMRVVDNRAGLLPAEKAMDQAALDKYEYLRSAYLQRRRHLVFDGNPPREVLPEE